MSIYQRAGSKYWHYRFEHRGTEYRGTTGQTDENDARAVEAKERLRIRQAAYGIAAPARIATPTFQDWAEIFYPHAAKRVSRPDRIQWLLRVALRFFGERPQDTAPQPALPGEPYRNLRLGDLIDRPELLLDFERWLDQPHVVAPARTRWGKPAPPGPTRMITWAGQTKNQQRSLASQMYKLAMSPQWRAQSGVLSNPFVGLWRDPPVGRQRALELEDLTAILDYAGFHLRVAIAIGLLAPKFRLGNILALRWDEHVSADLRYITVHQHKTRRHTGKPLVAYVPDQLVEILQEAKRRAAPRQCAVVQYQGRALRSLTDAVAGAVRRASSVRPNLIYGRRHAEGITFHTIRHTAATLLAELEIPGEKRQQFIGHKHLSTTMLYTHLRPVHEEPVAELLSGAASIKAAVMAGRTRARSAVTAAATAVKNASTKHRKEQPTDRMKEID